MLVTVSMAAGAGLVYLIRKPESDGDTVVLGIRGLNELAMVEQTIQAIMVQKDNASVFSQPLPEFLTGEKLLLVAVEEVEAGVDLDELGEDDVRVKGKTITIELPQARILDFSLSEDDTKLYDRDRGLLKLRGNDALIEEARRDALDEIQEKAKNNDILEQA